MDSEMYLEDEGFTLSELVDLSLGTPEVGAVNFNILRILLHEIIRKVDMENVLANLTDLEAAQIESFRDYLGNRGSASPLPGVVRFGNDGGLGYGHVYRKVSTPLSTSKFKGPVSGPNSARNQGQPQQQSPQNQQPPQQGQQQHHQPGNKTQQSPRNSNQPQNNFQQVQGQQNLQPGQQNIVQHPGQQTNYQQQQQSPGLQNNAHPNQGQQPGHPSNVPQQGNQPHNVQQQAGQEQQNNFPQQQPGQNRGQPNVQYQGSQNNAQSQGQPPIVQQPGQMNAPQQPGQPQNPQNNAQPQRQGQQIQPGQPINLQHPRQPNNFQPQQGQPANFQQQPGQSNNSQHPGQSNNNQQPGQFNNSQQPGQVVNQQRPDQFQPAQGQGQGNAPANRNVQQIQNNQFAPSNQGQNQGSMPQNIQQPPVQGQMTSQNAKNQTMPQGQQPVNVQHQGTNVQGPPPKGQPSQGGNYPQVQQPEQMQPGQQVLGQVQQPGQMQPGQQIPSQGQHPGQQIPGQGQHHPGQQLQPGQQIPGQEQHPPGQQIPGQLQNTNQGHQQGPNQQQVQLVGTNQEQVTGQPLGNPPQFIQNQPTASGYTQPGAYQGTHTNFQGPQPMNFQGQGPHSGQNVQIIPGQIGGGPIAIGQKPPANLSQSQEAMHRQGEPLPNQGLVGQQVQGPRQGQGLSHQQQQPGPGTGRSNQNLRRRQSNHQKLTADGQQQYTDPPLIPSAPYQTIPPTSSTNTPRTAGVSRLVKKLEDKIAKLETHLDALYALPKNVDLLDVVDGRKRMDVNDMWQIIQLNNRTAATEAAIQKLASLIEDLARQLKAIKQESQLSIKANDQIINQMGPFEGKFNEAQFSLDSLRHDFEKYKDDMKRQMEQIVKDGLNKVPSFMRNDGKDGKDGASGKDDHSVPADEIHIVDLDKGIKEQEVLKLFSKNPKITIKPNPQGGAPMAVLKFKTPADAELDFKNSRLRKIAPRKLDWLAPDELKIENLPAEVNESQLKKKFPAAVSIKMRPDHGQAIVKFKSNEEASRNAIMVPHVIQLGDRAIGWMKPNENYVADVAASIANENIKTSVPNTNNVKWMNMINGNRVAITQHADVPMRHQAYQNATLPKRGPQELVWTAADSSNLSKYVLGSDGKPILDANGKPYLLSDVLLGRDGRPLLGPDGKPILKDQIMLDQYGNPYLDKNGKPLLANDVLFGDDGRPILGPDGSPMRLDQVILDPFGKPHLDQYGNPLLASQVLFDAEGKLILGPDGKPMLADGYLFDEHGNLLLGADGKPRRASEVLFDQFGKPLRDANGRLVLKHDAGVQASPGTQSEGSQNATGQSSQSQQYGPEQQSANTQAIHTQEGFGQQFDKDKDHANKNEQVDSTGQPIGSQTQDHQKIFGDGTGGPIPVDIVPSTASGPYPTLDFEASQDALKQQMSEGYIELQDMQRQLASDIQDKMEFIYQKLLREIANQQMTSSPYMAIGPGLGKCMGPGICTGHGMPAGTAVCQFPALDEASRLTAAYCGTGQVEACPHCHGTGHNPLGLCSHCQGTGHAKVQQHAHPETCSYCHGLGKSTTGTTCPHCQGLGKTALCPHCHGHGKLHGSQCPHCQGQGKTALCSHCLGLGKINSNQICPHCHGSGTGQCHLDTYKICPGPGICPGMGVCPTCKDTLHSLKPPTAQGLDRPLEPETLQAEKPLENEIQFQDLKKECKTLILLPKDLEELRERIKGEGKIPNIFDEMDILERLHTVWDAVNALKHNDEALAVRMIKLDSALKKFPRGAVMEKIQKIPPENLDAIASASPDRPLIIPSMTSLAHSGVDDDDCNLLAGNKKHGNGIGVAEDDIQTIFNNLSNLLVESATQKERLEGVSELMKNMEQNMVTKHMLIDAMSDKADKGQMNTKVSYDEFGNSMDELTTRMQNLLIEVYQKNENWKNITDHLGEELSTKLDKIELAPVRAYFKSHLKTLEERVNYLTSQLEVPDPAGTRKKLLKDFNCISCDRHTHISGVTNSPQLPVLGPILAGHTTASQRAYDLHRMRQQKFCKFGAGDGCDMNLVSKQLCRGGPRGTSNFETTQQSLNESDVLNMVNRYVGGSHTTVSTGDRIAAMHKRMSTKKGETLGESGPDEANYFPPPPPARPVQTYNTNYEE